MFVFNSKVLLKVEKKKERKKQKKNRFCRTSLGQVKKRKEVHPTTMRVDHHGRENSAAKTGFLKNNNSKDSPFKRNNKGSMKSECGRKVKCYTKKMNLFLVNSRFRKRVKESNEFVMTCFRVDQPC